jgi:hypothetical protein
MIPNLTLLRYQLIMIWIPKPNFAWASSFPFPFWGMKEENLINTPRKIDAIRDMQQHMCEPT